MNKSVLTCFLVFLGQLCYADGGVINKISMEEIKKEELSSQITMNTMFYQTLAYDRAQSAIKNAEDTYDRASANNASITAGDNSINVIIQDVVGDTIAVGR